MARSIQMGPFDLEEPIGRGGAAEVWRGVHREQNLPVAVKVVVPNPDHSMDPHAQFGDEVRAVASLNHSGIITVFDYGQVSSATALASGGRIVPGMPYLVMELVTGGSLLDRGTLGSFTHLRTTLLELLDALAHAHARDVIHRDIKAGNVLVSEVDGSLKLTDFGIAHALRGRQASELDPRATGTPHYMAPEQIRGVVRDQGPWTDLYAVGCLVYRLVTGHPPFFGEVDDLASLVAHQLFKQAPPLLADFDFPPSFQVWLNRLLEKAPKDRYRFAADAAFDLINLEQEAMVVAVDTTVNRAQKDWAEQTARFTRQTLPGWATDADETLIGSVNPFATGATTVPPPPDSWRRPGPPTRSAQLRGAGLGLHGLRRVPIVGREEARDAIWEALKAVHETRETQTIVLRGPAGVGKSRLAEWICERAHEVGSATVLRATHGPFPALLAGLPRMVAKHYRCLGLPREEVLERLTVMLKDEGFFSEYELLSLVEFIAPTRGEEAETAVRFRSPRDRHALMVRFLQRLADSRPVILWLEDVQWAQETLDFVKHLISMRDSGVLVLATARDETLERWGREAELISELTSYQSVTTLEIGPLAAGHLAQLVRGTLGLAEDLVATIVQRCQGNPLFAVQLVDDWVERRWLEVGGDGFRLKAGVVPVLPDDLHHVWQYRLGRLLDGLPPESSIALELGATLGREMDDWEWQQVCERAGLAFPDELLERLLDQHLIHSSESGWSFVHQMLRESVERTAQEAGRRIEGHQLCADTLADVYFYDHPGIAERIGRHLFEAGDFEGCLSPLAQAVNQQLQRSSFVAGKLLLDLREKALEAASIPPDARQWAEQLMRRARSSELLGELDLADGFAARTIECAERNGHDDLLARSFRILGDVRRQKGDLDSAWTLLHRAIELSDARGDLETLATAVLPVADMARRAGDLEHARSLISRGERAASRCENPISAINFITLRALIALHTADSASARTLFADAATRYTAIGSELGVANCTKGRGDVERHAGDYRRARELYLEAYEVYKSINASDAVIRLQLLLLDVAEGAFTGAEDGLSKLIAELEEGGRRGFAEYVRVALVPCLAARRAWEPLRSALESTRKLLASGRVLEPDVALSLELASVQTRVGGAQQLADELAAIAAEHWRKLGQTERAQALDATIMQTTGAL